MDTMAAYVGNHNVSRFLDQLHSETDSARRALLQKLLLEEEDRLGHTLQQLELADRQLAKCRAHISQQQTLVQTLKADGRNASNAERVLSNLLAIENTFMDVRRVIEQALARSKL